MTTRGRVLIVGPGDIGDMAWFLAVAYRRLEWEVITFDDRAFVGRRVPGVVGKAVLHVERDVLTRRRRGVGRRVRALAASVDHVVTVKGEYFLPEDVDAIGSTAPFVNWHPDHPFLDEHLACIAHYTAFCPKDDWSTERLRAMGYDNVRTLVHASDPVLLHGERLGEPKRTMSVAGGVYPYRQRWIDEAVDLGLSVRVWGGVVPGDEPAVVSNRARALGRDLGVALRTGSFTLNTHHPHDVAGANQRLFDAAASGAPQLTERLPDSARHFEPGEEICTFGSVEEFRDAADELSRDPAAGDRLARNSAARVRDEHTYEHRIAEILSMI